MTPVEVIDEVVKIRDSGLFVTGVLVIIESIDPEDGNPTLIVLRDDAGRAPWRHLGLLQAGGTWLTRKVYEGLGWAHIREEDE